MRLHRWIRVIKPLVTWPTSTKQPHVWKVLRNLGWSCQRPTGRALERNEALIRRWEKEQRPDLKKSSKA
ncbi:MAG: winged helix-turn-helix domain-containing protein [Acidobacteriia bacterium]|nr:winged helix-turn-helix domain-containing protein [Terriglobia bacterium]